MVSSELEARLDNLLSTAQEETADIDMFAPIPLREECPICMIPLPLFGTESIFFACCGKLICKGCTYKNSLTKVKNGTPIHEILNNEMKCAFCQQLSKLTYKNEIKCLKKLMKKNNIQAFRQMAGHYMRGEGVIESDTRALEMYIRAAELGDYANAFAMIGDYYFAIEQNDLKAAKFWEISAKKGSAHAHKELSLVCARNGDIQKGIEHSKVAASAGFKESMDSVMKAYKHKVISKEDLTITLRAFQASNDATKSKDRDDARALKERKSGVPSHSHLFK